MKKILLPLLLLFSITLTAQIDLTVAPIGESKIQLGGGIDFVISQNASFELSAFTVSGEKLLHKWKEFGASGFFKLYLNHHEYRKARGGYIAAFSQYSNRNFKLTSSPFFEYEAEKMVAGLALGYKGITLLGVIIEGHLGYGKLLSNNNEFDNELVNDWHKQFWIFRLAVGYRFRSYNRD